METPSNYQVARFDGNFRVISYVINEPKTALA